jgi:hypothetical protein
MLVDLLNGGPGGETRWVHLADPVGSRQTLVIDPCYWIDNMGGSCWILVLGPVGGLFALEPVSVFRR